MEDIVLLEHQLHDTEFLIGREFILRKQNEIEAEIKIVNMYLLLIFII